MFTQIKLEQITSYKLVSMWGYFAKKLVKKHFVQSIDRVFAPILEYINTLIKLTKSNQKIINNNFSNYSWT